MVQFLLPIIYLAFISLGLPDSLLGAAWPAMQGDLGVPISYAGIISMIIAAGTVVSSLFSDWLTRRLGTGKVTALSVAMTAAALLGFSAARSFWILCLWAVPYGLGAGSVDAALNNYVALHYESRHMSWLHCMWGIGATAGPWIMGAVLGGGGHWSRGYQYIGIIQAGLTLILILSLPLWKQKKGAGEAAAEEKGRGLTLWEIFRLPGAKAVMCCFFCYSAVEQTVILWASSYLSICRGMSPQLAAKFAGMFFIGITLGRGICGFIAIKLSDTQMIRMGQILIGAGAAALLFPGSKELALVGLVLIGLGCAPIYPSIIHSTPDHFGEDRSQAIIGVQMASAYVGTCLMPPLFGLIANHITPALLPVYLLALLGMMAAAHEILNRQAPLTVTVHR